MTEIINRPDIVIAGIEEPSEPVVVLPSTDYDRADTAAVQRSLSLLMEKPDIDQELLREAMDITRRRLRSHIVRQSPPVRPETLEDVVTEEASLGEAQDKSKPTKIPYKPNYAKQKARWERVCNDCPDYTIPQYTLAYYALQRSAETDPYAQDALTRLPEPEPRHVALEEDGPVVLDQVRMALGAVLNGSTRRARAALGVTFLLRGR